MAVYAHSFTVELQVIGEREAKERALKVNVTHRGLVCLCQPGALGVGKGEGPPL